MDLKLGIFVVPDATDAASRVAQIIEAERSGLDMVGVQDHPYQWRFFDTWTLLAYVAGRTEGVRFLPDVLNLPLRLPSMIAKSVASLDILSGGRVELGIGAGAFWDAIAAMGGPPPHTEGVGGCAGGGARDPAQLLVWAALRSLRGRALPDLRSAPRPAARPPSRIYLGAYGPRMLRLTGRLADGWLPSLGEHYLHPEDASKGHAAIDEAARAAGRDPAEIERALNVMALEGQPATWADQLARIVEELRFSTLLVGVPLDDPVTFVRRLAEDVGPRLRELLA